MIVPFHLACLSDLTNGSVAERNLLGVLACMGSHGELGTFRGLLSRKPNIRRFVQIGAGLPIQDGKLHVITYPTLYHSRRWQPGTGSVGQHQCDAVAVCQHIVYIRMPSGQSG